MAGIRERVVGCALVVATGCPGDDGSSGDGVGGSSSTAAPADTSTGAADAESTGAAGESSSGGTVVVDYETDIQPIWNNCTCHQIGPSGMMEAEVLTLNQGMSYGQLVGTPSEQAPLSRIAAGDLEGSYLWHKLQGTHLDVGGMGDPMPQVGMLSAEDEAAIEAWIVGGAQP